MKRNIQLLLLLVLSTTQLQAQDLAQYKRVVKTLSSAKYQGRGYANALVCCDFWFSYKHKKDFSRQQKAGECNNAGLLQTCAAQSSSLSIPSYRWSRSSTSSTLI